MLVARSSLELLALINRSCSQTHDALTAHNATIQELRKPTYQSRKRPSFMAAIALNQWYEARTGSCIYTQHQHFQKLPYYIPDDCHR